MKEAEMSYCSIENSMPLTFTSVRFVFYLKQTHGRYKVIFIEWHSIPMFVFAVESKKLFYTGILHQSPL